MTPPKKPLLSKNPPSFGWLVVYSGNGVRWFVCQGDISQIKKEEEERGNKYAGDKKPKYF